jgi:hypothetical protein
VIGRKRRLGGRDLAEIGDNIFDVASVESEGCQPAEIDEALIPSTGDIAGGVLATAVRNESQVSILDRRSRRSFLRLQRNPEPFSYFSDAVGRALHLGRDRFERLPGSGKLNELAILWHAPFSFGTGLRHQRSNLALLDFTGACSADSPVGGV